MVAICFGYGSPNPQSHCGDKGWSVSSVLTNCYDTNPPIRAPTIHKNAFSPLATTVDSKPLGPNMSSVVLDAWFLGQDLRSESTLPVLNLCMQLNPNSTVEEANNKLHKFTESHQ